MEFGGEGVDFAGELGVGFEFEFLFGEVVVGFWLVGMLLAGFGRS